MTTASSPAPAARCSAVRPVVLSGAPAPRDRRRGPSGRRRPPGRRGRPSRDRASNSSSTATRRGSRARPTGRRRRWCCQRQRSRSSAISAPWWTNSSSMCRTYAARVRSAYSAATGPMGSAEPLVVGEGEVGVPAFVGALQQGERIGRGGRRLAVGPVEADRRALGREVEPRRRPVLAVHVDEVPQPPRDGGERLRLGRGSGPSATQLPSPRGRIVQHPGAGSQKYSSSVSPSTRARGCCHTSSDRSTSSRFMLTMLSEGSHPRSRRRSFDRSKVEGRSVPSVVSSTRLTRHVNAPRSAVYRALLDPEAVQRWMVPDGMTSEVHPSMGGGRGLPDLAHLRRADGHRQDRPRPTRSTVASCGSARRRGRAGGRSRPTIPRCRAG